MRTQTLQLTRTAAELEGQLALATARHAAAEQAALERGFEPAEAIRPNSPLMPVVVLALVLGAGWLDGDFQLPRWLLWSASLLAAAWLLRDGWRFGRARARGTRA